MVVKALEFCQKNPRANGETLKKMQNTKFKGWPAHLDIAVLPNLLKYGQTFMRIAAVQKMIDADPEPVMNDLMSPAPAPAPQPAETPAVDEPGPEETRIDDE
jgi:ABC-type nitrate/sulfonate/bicarbonate transport system substrate-binding protein